MSSNINFIITSFFNIKYNLILIDDNKEVLITKSNFLLNKLKKMIFL